MKEIKGNLIRLAKEGRFDIIAHGCNCFCTMGSGIAPQIKNAFNGAWTADANTISGDFNKLGNYTSSRELIGDQTNGFKELKIINIYSQYNHNASEKPLDYEALTLAFRKINHYYKGLTIGLPLIGAGLAGGDWAVIKQIMIDTLVDMDIVIVHYDAS